MKKIKIILWNLFLCLLFITGNVFPQTSETSTAQKGINPADIRPTRIAVEPKIDGILDEPVWKTVLKVSDYKTNVPDYGKVPSVKTETYMAYDSDNLYFAFRCYEPDASKIKGAVTGRDKMINDDWICVNLDSFGDMQTLYAIYVNPYGIQGDSRATRTNEDFQFDLLWDCASSIDAEGYTVEMRIPVKSIRFPETNPVEMRVLLQRNMVLRNEMGAYPPMDPSKGSDWLTQTSPIIYEGLNNHKLLEILPAMTYSYKENAANGTLAKDESKGKLSLTGKYGITQDLTFDATYNPDFSQVESDAGKVDVNLRYQLYYPEARSFFKEGSENFTMAIGPTLIHTRRIVNPIFGAKLAGQVATGHTIAALYAKDEFASIPGQTGKYTDYGILRYKADLGNSSYLGSVFGAKELSDFHNRIAAVDGYIKTSDGGGISLFGSYTSLDDKINSINNNGHSIQAGYLETSRDKRLNFGFQKVSEFFDSQLGLMDRTGILNFYGLYGPNFYPKSGIFTMIRPAVYFNITRDDPSGIWETGVQLSTNTQFVNRIAAGINVGTNREVFLGTKFNTDFVSFALNYQLSSELFVALNLGMRNSIYYSGNPYQGYTHSGSGSFVFQPLSNLDFTGSFSYSDFYDKSNDTKVYDYLILRLRTTYQVNKYLFFRGIIESNNYRKTLLTDFLISYTYIPGTVIYLGYGSLYEKVEWKTDRYLQSDNYMQTKRGFFFKASYLWRL